MEHVIITEMGDDFLQLTPEAGYKLYNEAVQRYYSEAVVKKDAVDRFAAVKVAEPTDEDPISPAEALRIITGR